MVNRLLEARQLEAILLLRVNAELDIGVTVEWQAPRADFTANPTLASTPTLTN